MKVKVIEVNKETRIAKVQIGDDFAECKIKLPNNKGAEKNAWVDISGIKEELGAGDHKNWLTVPRDMTEPIEFETVKKPHYPAYIHINNIKYYCTPAEYEIVKQIFDRATAKLNEERKNAGL